MFIVYPERARRGEWIKSAIRDNSKEKTTYLVADISVMRKICWRGNL